MKKRCTRYIFLFFLSILIIPCIFNFIQKADVQRPLQVSAENYPPQQTTNKYEIRNYNVDITVGEDNVLHIVENIDVYFNIEQHGIFREIPIVNKIKRLDGSTETNRAKIKNIDVDNIFVVVKKSGYKVIKIGDPDKYVKGDHSYKISYDYKLGRDRTKDFDELYFNIIGTEWDTTIDKVTFKITMPKEFDQSKLGFSQGSYGSTNSDNIQFTVNDNVITGMVTSQLKAYEGLTIRLELPEGYFNVNTIFLEILDVLGFAIPIASVIIAITIVLRLKSKNKKDYVETVEFYPPKGLNSADVALIKYGFCSQNNLMSLIVYFASHGYLKIYEAETLESYLKKDTMILVKQKDYDGNNGDLARFFDSLFTSAVSYETNMSLRIKGNTNITIDDLKDKTYVVVHNLKCYTFSKEVENLETAINSKENKSKYFNNRQKIYKSIITCMALLSLLASTFISLEINGFSNIFLYLFPIIALMLSTVKKIPLIIRIFWCTFFFGLPAIFGIYKVIFELDITYKLMAIIGIICVILLLINKSLVVCYNENGRKLIAKINSFKKFLITAEKDRIEMLVSKNPHYFYDILPYAYVLKISRKWIDKFEEISKIQPDWYIGQTVLNIGSFHSCMSTLSSVSHYSSSGGGSGGGSSGGGSGGGGGGSW